MGLSFFVWIEVESCLGTKYICSNGKYLMCQIVIMHCIMFTTVLCNAVLMKIALDFIYKYEKDNVCHC